MARLLSAARAIFGPAGISKREGLSRGKEREDDDTFFPIPA